MKANLRKAIVIAATVLATMSFAVPAMASTNTYSAPATKVMATANKKVALKSVKMNKKTMSLKVGKSASLKVSFKPANASVKKVTWKTSNKNIATVSKNGKVTAKKAGTVTITATVNGKKATCKVTVNAEKKATVLSANAAPTANSNTAAAATQVTINSPANSTFVSTADCYSMLNTYRSNVGKSSLAKDAFLESLAKMRAVELIQKFSHTRPNGGQGLAVIPGNLYKGENIAKGQRNCASVMNAWYNSEGHRANMLDGHYTKVGIAGIEYEGTIYWVQLFSN